MFTIPEKLQLLYTVWCCGHGHKPYTLQLPGNHGGRNEANFWQNVWIAYMLKLVCSHLRLTKVLHVLLYLVIVTNSRMTLVILIFVKNGHRTLWHSADDMTEIYKNASTVSWISISPHHFLRLRWYISIKLQILFTILLSVLMTRMSSGDFISWIVNQCWPNSDWGSWPCLCH